MSGPLEDIRVIDCGVFQAGPTAGVILADLGADVFKVEPRISGDPGRGAEIFTRSTSRIRSGTAQFEAWNRNKRSMTLDLTKEKGKEVLYCLISKADVIINNWRLGTAEKLKVDYETLIQYNPKIIYGSISGWGMKGQESKEPAFDFAAIARSGMTYQAGKPGDPPMVFVSGYADTTAGIVLAQGILAALVVRERRQVGQKVEVSLLGGMVAGLQRLPVNTKAQSGDEMPRRDRANMGNPLWNYYQCSDAKWIALSMLTADVYWSSFCEALGIRELENDPRFINLDVRSQTENSKELIRILDKIFATRPQKEWLSILSKHKLIFGPVQTISDLLSDPQVLENQYILDYDHPIYGPIKIVGFPWSFSSTEPNIRLPAPQLGQHTEEILLEFGYSWDDISNLKEQEVI
jgi:crotonobetainyl-CoA:carnitine CoA-transferase CaiB-like acyl-CoA transferase